METLGSLMDKLAIANIRLWHLEEQRRNKNFTDAERLKAADMVSVVNSQRNELIDEIDELLQSALSRGSAPRAPKMKLY